jgi:nucleoside-diphosphate-sugar epimerase
MQTILGSGGTIATELAKNLPQYTDKIRLVSRTPSKVKDSDELMAADLTDANQVRAAVKDSDVVYVTIGFPYKAKVWKELWPPFIKRVIDACEEYGAKLVFFDNVYMYDPDHLDGMTEETPIQPASKKGKVRAEIAEMIMGQARTGNIKALIARCADYYGPHIDRNGILNETVIKPLANGKKANWLGSINFKHSFTYTPDAGKATALLGNTESAFGQVWHLPTAKNPPTGKEWVEMVAERLGVEPKVQIAPKWLVGVIGWFNPMMKELHEMVYQYDRHYDFNSDKFEKAFDFKPQSYLEGLKTTLREDYGK